MKEFLKYVLYFGIVCIVYCVVIFTPFALFEIDFYWILLIMAFFCPLYYIINIELLFRLYKYDRKKNPLKNKKVLKILRFILYSLGVSVVSFWFLSLVGVVMSEVFTIITPGFFSGPGRFIAPRIEKIFFACVFVAEILIMCLYIFYRTKKFLIQ